MQVYSNVAAKPYGSAEEILAEPVGPRRRTTAEECPFCVEAPVKENDSRCLGVCRNPQNCPGPEVFPHELQTAEDAVRLQCNALADCHEPRRYHGLQVLYEFACDAGRMERSRFFGFSSDMYHFDHFMGKAGHHFKGLVGAAAWAFEGVEPGPRGRVHVAVRAEGRAGQASRFVFVMQRHDQGKYAGCWCTAQLLPAGSKWLEAA